MTYWNLARSVVTDVASVSINIQTIGEVIYLSSLNVINKQDKSLNNSRLKSNLKKVKIWTVEVFETP